LSYILHLFACKLRQDLGNDPTSCICELVVARPCQVLEAVGFRVEEGAVQLSEDAPLAPLQAALARLRRVADLRGHSGSAEFFPLSACGAGGAIHDAARSPLLV